MKIKFLLISFVLLTSFAKAQTVRTQRLDSLFNYLTANEDFNGNVLFAEDGKVIYKKCIGYADFDTKALLNEDSMFELASLSKGFTAMGILILMEHEKLSLTDTLGKFFEEFPYPGLTIKQLLTHTSGIPDYMKLFGQHWDKTKIATNKDVLALLAEYKPALLFKPGETFSYSNTGYAVLALVIEKVSGISYADYLKQNIFVPLAMKHTRVYNRQRLRTETPANLALGYYIDPKTKLPVRADRLPGETNIIYLDGIVGDGSVNSTIVDLLKWDRALYTDKLVKNTTLAEAFTPVTLPNGHVTGYGYGWGFRPGNSITGREIGHSGGWAGFDTYIDRFVDRDKTIIILRNTSNNNRVSGLNEAYTNILFDGPLILPKIEHRAN